MIIEQETKWTKNRRKVSKKAKGLFILPPVEKVSEVKRYPIFDLKAEHPEFNATNEIPCIYIEEMEQSYVYDNGSWRVFKGTGDPPIPDELASNPEYTGVLFDYENDAETFNLALVWCEANCKEHYKLAEVTSSLATSLVLSENDSDKAVELSKTKYNEPIIYFKSSEEANKFEDEFASLLLSAYDINDRCSTTRKIYV